MHMWDIFDPLRDMEGGRVSHILLAASSTTYLLSFIELEVIL